MYALYHQLGTVRLYIATTKLNINDVKIRDINIDFNKRHKFLWFVLPNNIQILYDRPTPDPFPIVDDEFHTNLSSLQKWWKTNKQQILGKLGTGGGGYYLESAKIIC
jgi:hypothetical protein